MVLYQSMLKFGEVIKMVKVAYDGETIIGNRLCLSQLETLGLDENNKSYAEKIVTHSLRGCGL